jgi:hypothetical protein
MSDTFHTSTSTLRSKIDYFGLVTAIGATKVKCVASAENPTVQTTNGQNTYGDSVVVDAYGQTAAPSSEYEVIGAISSQAITLGTITSTNKVLGTANLPVCLGGISIATQTGSAPKITANGQALFTGATQLRSYILPAFNLSPRHRAQDIFADPLVTIKYNTNTAALPTFDYGLSSVNANFPIEFTTALPQGQMLGYDLHGGAVTVDYTLNWYRTDHQPEIAINTAAYANSVIPIKIGTNTYFNAPITLTNPVGRSDPENGYTQYTFQVSFPLVGAEAA